MTDSELQKLIVLYLKDEISDVDYRLLEVLLEDEKNAAIFKQYVQDDYVLKNANRQFDANLAKEKLLSQISGSKKPKIFITHSILKYAAVVIILFGLGLFLKSLLFTTNSVGHSAKQVEVVFENGQRSFIGEVNSIGEEKLTYGEVSAQTLTYFKNESLPKSYNTLKVPYGKRFNLVLSDGTKVHMNAGSSLRYPINFPKTGQRNVHLEGEAFFDVAKDSSRPYIVHTDGLDIEVLGTEFNVQAYSDDIEIKTTLREGSVKVYNSDEELILAPNEQSSWIKGKKELNKQDVESSRFTGWMNGQLSFRSVPFKEIIKKMERHYDVQIVNNDEQLDDELFTAIFEEETFEEAILYFSKGYGFEYTIENNKILIE